MLNKINSLNYYFRGCDIMDIKSFVGKLHNILIQFSVKYVHNYAENIECYVLMLYILKCIYRIY